MESVTYSSITDACQHDDLKCLYSNCVPLEVMFFVKSSYFSSCNKC